MGAERRKLVLLAEDDAQQAEVLQEVLEYEGYRVLVAVDPSEVLARLAQGPDVVLLDVGGVTSPEVARALEAAPRRPALLLVSADPHLAEIAAELGADRHLCKPYDLEELLRGVRELARGPGLPREPDSKRCWAPGP